MKYQIKELYYNKKLDDFIFVFDKKYELLSNFLSSDVTPFEDWMKEDFDAVLSGKEEKREIAGNVCGIEITAKTTKIFDNLAEDGMGNWCEIDTKELRQLIDEWCEKVREFKNRKTISDFPEGVE